MKTKQIAFIISISYIIAIALYMSKFNKGFSNTINDWAGFGNYISGVLMPILTTINIWVFIKLTIAISDENAKTKDRELFFKKKLFVTQQRQKELDHFIDILDQSLVLKANILPSNICEPIVSAVTYLGSFIEGQSELFPILITEQSFKNNILELYKFLRIYYDLINNSLPDKNGKLPNFNSENLKSSINDTLKCKNEVVNALQKFIFEDIYLF